MHDRATRTSLEVHFAAGHCVPAGSRTIGFPRFDPTAVSVGKIAFPARPSPAPFGAGSFPRASLPLRSLFACLPAPPFSSAQSCLGVPSLFAASLKVSTQRGHSSSLVRLVPSSGFLNLSTVFSTFGFAGFFHPAATSRVSVQGFGPASQPWPIRHQPVPPCPFRARAHRLPGCHTHATGLRGFLPRSDTYDGFGV